MHQKLTFDNTFYHSHFARKQNHNLLIVVLTKPQLNVDGPAVAKLSSLVASNRWPTIQLVNMDISQSGPRDGSDASSGSVNYFAFTGIYYGSVFSEREHMFTFAICYRPSVCLSCVCL